MEGKDTCFCEESFIDRSFLVLEILRGVLCTHQPHGYINQESPWWIGLWLLLDIETIQVLLQLRNFAILNLIFLFKNVEKEEILKELNNLNNNNATKNTDISTKIKGKFWYFWRFHFLFISITVKNGRCNTPWKRTQKVQNIFTNQLVYCQKSPKCVNGSRLNKCQNILNVLFSLNIIVDSGKVLELSTV